MAGTVESVLINMGTHVKAGQLIATLDAASLQSSYDAAKATLQQAEDAYNRMKQLYDNGSLPEMQWVEVQSKLQQARSMEQISAKNLTDCNLYAPFDGIIAEESLEVGQNVMPGTPVAKLVNASALNVKISMPETDIARLDIGTEATVEIPAIGRQTFRARVTEKGIVANSISRSYDIKLLISNASQNIMPGMIANVSLPLGTNDGTATCVIPANIVQLDEHNQNFVWVAQNGKATKRDIECGNFTTKGVEITSGLSVGELVITEGQHKVCEGTEITFE